MHTYLRVLSLLWAVFIASGATQLGRTSRGPILTSSDFLKVPRSQRVNRSINIIDCTIENGHTMVNKVFGTDFQSAGGLAMDVISDAGVLYAPTDSIPSSQWSPIVSFFLSISGKVVLLMDGRNLESSLSGYEHLLRTLVQHCSLGAVKSAVTHIDVVLATAGSGNVEVLEARLRQRFHQLWSEEASVMKSFDDAISLKVIGVANDTPGSVRASLEANCPVGEYEGSWSQILERAWAATKEISATTKEHQSSVGEVEAVYAKNLGVANGVLNDWQRRISSGRSVINFGARVRSLMHGIQRDFQDSTAGGAAVIERAERLRALNAHVVSSVAQLQQRQVQLTLMEATNRFRTGLLKLAVIEGEEKRKAAEEDLVQKLASDFKSRIQAMDSEWLSGIGDSQANQLEESMKTVSSEVLESAAFKLREAETELKRQQKAEPAGAERKKKGTFGLIDFRISLVGMLRPPGFGNFQGYLSTATKALGIPIDFALGVQNDGDSMEVLGEEREHPLLKLQPKIRFNLQV